MGNINSTRTSDWQGSCAAAINASCSALSNMTDIVDVFGNPIPFTCPADNELNFSGDLWGVTGPVCERYCGSDKIVQDYSSIAEIVITMSTWLFPFVALIAQLPFETKSALHNFYSACLALGSPALITYSLALTSMNRAYVHEVFSRLREEELMRDRKAVNPPHSLATALDAAWFILAEVQQAPIRANPHDNELRRLIFVPENLGFWTRVKQDLLKTRRGFTYSFFAQALFAAISYLFAFVTVMHEDLGDPTVGLHFATSIVWSWMFPVVFGYIYVGSQYTAGTIGQALSKKIKPVEGSVEKVIQRGVYQSIPHHQLTHRMDTSDALPFAHPSPSPTLPFAHPLPLPTPVSSTTPDSSRLPIYATMTEGCQSSEGPSPQSHLSTLPAIQVSPVRRHPSISMNIEAPPWLGRDVRGHEMVEGPIFNYARIFTWFQLVDRVQMEFESHSASQPTMQAADWRTYDRFRQINPRAFYHILWASVVAMALQWGTTGAGILAAYKTPTVGLACRSGSYLLYGLLATFAWVLLLAGAFCSHWIMVRFEEVTKVAGGDAHEELLEWSDLRMRPIRLVSALAVIFRTLGKAVAIANTGWLFAFSLMDDLGFFRNCWCNTVALTYHNEGWTTFNTGGKFSALREVSKDVWGGGFALSTVVFLGVTAFFLVSAKRGGV